MKRFVAIMSGNEVFAYLAFFLIICGGWFAASTMTREVFPSFSVDWVQVAVPYPSATPEEIEEGICLRIEEAVEGLEGIKKYQSTAQEGLGYTWIQVEEGYDIDKLKDEVRDRILAINTFPVDSEKPVVSELLTRSDVLYVSLWGDLPERQLKEQAEKIKEDLRRLPGVSQVGVSGVRDYEISIEVSEDRLREYGLTLEQVAARVRLECLNIPGGSVWTTGEEFKIRTMGRRYFGEEFRDLVVLTRPDGTVITLDRIADIRDAFEDETVYGMFNGKRAALITVYKTDEEDALAISKAVKTYVAAQEKRLPPDLNLTVWSDFSRLIKDRLDLLTGNGLFGFILVFSSLWLFLGLRLGFWVAMGIPVSLAGAMILMAATGQTINMISMFALIMTLGIIVDDAIVVGEAIYVQRLKGVPPFQAAVNGVLEVFWPIVGAITTTIVAFLPLFFMSGIMGKFISVLPVAVISALIVSLFEGLYLLPAHLNHLPDLNPDPTALGPLKRMLLKFRKSIEGSERKLVDRMYTPSVRFALRWRYVVFAVAIAVFFIMLGVIKGGLVKFVLFPQADTDFLITRVEFPTGTPQNVSHLALERIENGLRKVESELKTESGDPMVSHIYSTVGGFSGYDIQKGSHLAEIKVELLPTERRGLFYKEINRLWEKAVGPIEGALSLTFDTIEHGPPGKPIEIWFLGDDYESLLGAAGLLKERLRSLKGVHGVTDNHRPGKTEIRIQLKPAARTLGLTLADVGLQMRHGWYGNEPVRIQRGRDDIRIKVRYPMKERRSLADMERIRIRTPSGEEVPFHSVVEVAFVKGLTEIHRKNGKRLVSVSADVHTELANANEIMLEMVDQFLPGALAAYPGIGYEIEGQQLETTESVASLRDGFLFAIFAIFLILATIFRSYLQPLMILVTVPLGLIGAVLGHMVMGLDLTMMSLFGLVALTGIVVNDAIVFIECVNTRIKEGMPFFEAVTEGGKRRFRAIVLTTITTCAGLMPLIVERSVQAQYLIPMAITICSGVFAASILTLILVPCLMAILNDLRRGSRFIWNLKMPSRESVEPGTKRRETDDWINGV